MNRGALKISGVFILYAGLVALGFIAFGGILFYLSTIGILPAIVTYAYLVMAVLFLIPFFSTKWAASVVHRKYPVFSDWNKVFIYSGLFIFVTLGINPILEVTRDGSGLYGSGYILIAGVLLEIF